MILVLLAAAVISGVIGDVVDTVAIVAIVVLNAVIGFTQEYRAERAMAALTAMAAPTAAVVRDGVPSVIAAADLVPGDIVLLDAGRIVPADLRLLEAAHLRVEEAALTGESVPVEKSSGLVPEDALLGDRKSMAFSGTLVTAGQLRGVVVATGEATEIGRIQVPRVEVVGVGDRATVTGLTDRVIRLVDRVGGQYVALRAPDDVTATSVWTLPGAPGAAGSVLSTDASGSLSWISGESAVAALDAAAAAEADDAARKKTGARVR